MPRWGYEDEPYVSYDGQRYTVRQLAKLFNMQHNLLRYRLELGMSIQEAIFKKKHIKKHLYEGVEYSTAQLAKLHGMKPGTLLDRLSNGMSLKSALNKPVIKRGKR